jgi:CheY-like chemotaxis protein
VSHELRTPLNVISTWTQLLKLDPREENLTHGLQVIERNVRAQTKLIEDLLDLSRITSGKLRLSTRPMNLASVIEAASDALRPIVEDKGLSLEQQIEASEPMINGDADRMQQVVWNLLSNAAKFTPSGGRIAVRLDESADSLRLTVSDTGDGMEPEFLPHIFERFRQADSSSSRRYSGLGIGLNIVRHIVQLHGGTITADSAGKGRGSTFAVTLPRARVPVSDTSPPSTGSDAQHRISLEGIRILLVDDDADAREVVAQILRQHNAHVVTAADTSEALAHAAADQLDIVLTDLAMPGQDGFTLLHKLRCLSTDGRGHIPAFALTAYAQPASWPRGLKDIWPNPSTPMS